MAKRCEIYGGREADENRSSSAVFADRIADNNLVEGPDVERLRVHFRAMLCNPLDPKPKVDLESLLLELKGQGYADYRLESMLVRASARLSVPKQPEPVSARCLRRRALKEAV